MSLMQTDIRKKIVELDLLSNPNKLVDFLKDDDNNPEIR